jgi:succinate-acetate transporter protein
MEILREVLLFIHFLGLASLLGGLLVQVKGPQRRILAAVLHGALTQLVSGILLVGMLEALHSPEHPVNNVKLGVKLVVVLIITVLAWLNRKKPAIPNGLFFTLLVLTLANVGIAVFWH